MLSDLCRLRTILSKFSRTSEDFAINFCLACLCVDLYNMQPKLVKQDHYIMCFCADSGQVGLSWFGHSSCDCLRKSRNTSIFKHYQVPSFPETLHYQCKTIIKLDVLVSVLGVSTKHSGVGAASAGVEERVQDEITVHHPHSDTHTLFPDKP